MRSQIVAKNRDLQGLRFSLFLGKTFFLPQKGGGCLERSTNFGILNVETYQRKYLSYIGSLISKIQLDFRSDPIWSPNMTVVPFHDEALSK